MFHKSAIKRRHVRVPLVQIHPFSEQAGADEFGLPSEIKCYKWNEIIGNMGPFANIQNVMAGYHEHPLKYDGIFWKEAISCSLLKSLKTLIDDRKVISPYLFRLSL